MLQRIEFAPDAPVPLSGIRVVDLSRLVAGNMVSLQLADQGAEVIKIEDPKVGDPLRAWRWKGQSLYWKVYARNKKSLAMNLRPQAGRDVLLDLLATSQVLIENYRPGTLEQMGLGPDVLWARNPKLVIVRITGFGQDGPYRDRPGFGTLVEAMSGFASKNGFDDRPPVLPPLAMADMVSGLYGAYAVMVALRVVEHGGRGTDHRPAAAGAGGVGAWAGRGDLPDHGRKAATHRQPLADDVAAQRVPHRGRALHRDLGVDAGDGGARVPRHRQAGDDRRSALPHQHRPGAQHR